MTKLKHRFGFSLRPKPPYSFELTVQKPAGWPLFTPLEIFERGILWTALHIKDMLVGLRLRSKGSVQRPLIAAEVFLKENPSPEQKKAMKEALAAKLTVDQDLREFYLMARKDPILRHTVRDLYGMHDTNPGHMFSEATLAVLLQMAPLRRSEEMMECVIMNFGECAVFDGKKVYAWPTPEQVAKLNTRTLRKCRLGYRAKYILQLAKIFRAGFPTPEELTRLSPDEAKKLLLTLPGIGDYSSDIINPHGGFPIDAWSVDVFGKLFYGKEPKEGREAIERIKRAGIRRWGKYSWMAFLYIVHDLENLSKRLGTTLRLY